MKVDAMNTGHPSTTLFDKGRAIRSEVLGAGYVDKAIAQADDFSLPLQQLTTEWAWGSVWSRDGLERKTRSLLNLAILTALNRPEELAIHIRGALRNGATEVEIREVLLHTTVYCGIPAAADGFRVASRVLAEPRDG